MQKKLLFIVNARSGQGKIRTQMCEVLDIFIKAGYEVTVRITQASGDAETFAAENAGRFDRIVCSGGDGTLNGVVNGVLASGTDTPIGYLPAGSTNDYSKSLQIPTSIQKAAELAVTGTPHSFDVGCMGGRHFVYVAAFGAFTEITYKTPQDLKNAVGYLAYVVEGAKSLGSVRPYHMKITTPDAFIEDDFLVGMITNSVSVAGFKFPSIRNTSLDDGLLELLLVRDPGNIFEMPTALSDLMTGHDEQSRYITFLRTPEVKIECDTDVAWTMDGEDGGVHKDLLITNSRQAVRIVTRDDIPTLEARE